MGPLQPLHILYGLSCCSFVLIPLNMKYTCSLSQIKKKCSRTLCHLCFDIQNGHNPQCNSYKHLLTPGVIVTCSLALPPVGIPSSPRRTNRYFISYFIWQRIRLRAIHSNFTVFSRFLRGCAGRGEDLRKYLNALLVCWTAFMQSQLGAGAGGRCTVVINHNISKLHSLHKMHLQMSNACVSFSSKNVFKCPEKCQI